MSILKYERFIYVGIVGIPGLLFLILVSTYYSATSITLIFSYLLVLLLLVYGISGAKEVFIHQKYPGSGMPIIKGGSNDHSAFSRKSKGTTEVTVKVTRFNNATSKFDESSFKFNATGKTTVLSALLDIKSYSDNTLSVRCNCRMGICGSCGMDVNGKPKLACEANLLENSKDGVVEIGPMLGHPQLKDLADDFDDFFQKHKSVSPTLQRNDIVEKYAAKETYKQHNEDIEKFLPYSYCIMCGLCLDACPVVNSNPNFVGPQALSQVYRYHADSRDQGGKKRLLDIDNVDGAWGCEFSGSCSKACPKGVDPASAIQLLKADIIKDMSNDQ